VLERDGLSGFTHRAVAAEAEELSRHRGRVVAGYELYLLAARRPALRDAAIAWMQAGTEPLLDGVDSVRRKALVAAVNAVCLEALLADSQPNASDIEELIRHVLR